MTVKTLPRTREGLLVFCAVCDFEMIEHLQICGFVLKVSTMMV